MCKTQLLPYIFETLTLPSILNEKLFLDAKLLFNKLMQFCHRIDTGLKKLYTDYNKDIIVYIISIILIALLVLVR